MKNSLKAIAVAAAAVTTVPAAVAQQKPTPSFITSNMCIYDNVKMPELSIPVRVGIKGEEASVDLGSQVITMNKKGDVIHTVLTNAAQNRQEISATTIKQLQTLIDTYRSFCRTKQDELKL